MDLPSIHQQYSPLSTRQGRALHGRCRANSAHMRQSRQDYGLGVSYLFQAKIVKPFQVASFPLGSGDATKGMTIRARPRRSPIRILDTAVVSKLQKSDQVRYFQPSVTVDTFLSAPGGCIGVRASHSHQVFVHSHLMQWTCQSV